MGDGLSAVALETADSWIEGLQRRKVEIDA